MPIAETIFILVAQWVKDIAVQLESAFDDRDSEVTDPKGFRMWVIAVIVVPIVVLGSGVVIDIYLWKKKKFVAEERSRVRVNGVKKD
jgi:hypothetical protein